MTGGVVRRDDRFCPHCDVSMDLHDGPDSCESAEAKARLIEAFYGAFKRHEELTR